ncbi:MAG: hypothetical protein J2P58_07040 [Acidimicrobiaceae bacterium]|nr:hypothetical protein [Acidimicrobiaceae bacterium]
MSTKREVKDREASFGHLVYRSWVLLIAPTAVGLATNVPSVAAATAVHHPHSHTSIQWWVPFLIALAALAVIVVLVRTVQVRRRH